MHVPSHIKTIPHFNASLPPEELLIKLIRKEGAQKITPIKMESTTPQIGIIVNPLRHRGRRNGTAKIFKNKADARVIDQQPSGKERIKDKAATKRIKKMPNGFITNNFNASQFPVVVDPFAFGQRIVALGQNVKKPVTFPGRAFVGGVHVVRHLESLPCGGVVAVGLSNSMTGVYDIPDRTSPTLFEQSDPTHIPATFCSNN